jgi:hypothetical protein
MRLKKDKEEHKNFKKNKEQKQKPKKKTKREKEKMGEFFLNCFWEVFFIKILILMHHNHQGDYYHLLPFVGVLSKICTNFFYSSTLLGYESMGMCSITNETFGRFTSSWTPFPYYFKIFLTKKCSPCKKHMFTSFRAHCLMHMFALWENNKNKR